MGGAATGVLLDEVVDDVGLELALEVEEVVRYAENLADAPGVLHILDRAAAAMVGGGLFTIRDAPEAHGDADDIVALLLEEEGGDGGIYTSAHGDDDAGARHGQTRSFPPTRPQEFWG